MQPELFENATSLDPDAKTFRGANGVDLPYWERDGKIIRIALSKKFDVAVTNPKGGNIRANVPGFGIIEKKNKRNFLAQAAAARRSLEINDSARALWEEQRKQLLLAASGGADGGSSSERARSRNKLPQKNDCLAAGGSQVRFINPKKLLGAPGWEFGTTFRWLKNVPGISFAETIVYGWMVFRADSDGVFRRSLRSLENDAGVTWPHLIGSVIPSLLSRGLVYRDQGKRVRRSCKFLEHPAMFAGKESLPDCGQPALPRLDKRHYQNGKESWPHKEGEPKNEEEVTARETPAASDLVWLEQTVRRQFPCWTIAQLKEQWRLHNIKGKSKRQWSPYDRQHFIVAWMPRAGDPPLERKTIAEPKWWTAFVNERFPNAPLDFDTVSHREYFPSLRREGEEWARANGRST